MKPFYCVTKRSAEPLINIRRNKSQLIPLVAACVSRERRRGGGWQRKRPAPQKNGFHSPQLVKCISVVTPYAHIGLISACKRRYSLCMCVFFRCCIKRHRACRAPDSRPGCAGSPGSSSRLTAHFQPKYLPLVLQLGGQACWADTSKAWHSYSITLLWACSPAAATQMTFNIYSLFKIHILHRYDPIKSHHCVVFLFIISLISSLVRVCLKSHLKVI